MVARMGGDEFIVLLPEINTPEEILIVTGKIRAECAKPVLIDGHEMSIEISFGVSIFPDDAQDVRTLLKYADSALYQAKAEGRNNLQFYRPELATRLEHRIKLEAGLRNAISNGEFELYYQPIISLLDGAPVGAEALIRWHHPTLGLLQPDTFIPLAEETGLITNMGNWVITQACHEAARWPRHLGKDLMVAINASAQQFKAATFLPTIKQALASAGLDPKRLCVEITEQTLLENNEQNFATVAELKKLGVQIAIDDFGVGYSALSYLRRIAPTKIKIDRSLVNNVAVNADDAAIVRAVIAMAHTLKLYIVTEGVETETQHAFLQTEKCDSAQGFFYGRPCPAAEFRQWMSRIP